MSEEVKNLLTDARESMNKTLHHLETELGKVRAGHASVHMIDDIIVDYYGTNTPITQVANVNTMDAKTLMISPWEKNMLEPIEKAIIAANIGINPQNDGNVIRLVVPTLTEERRLELVKQVKHLGEESKVSIRNVRRDANDLVKGLQNDGLSEDLAKDAEGDNQKLTDEFSSLIEKHLEAKEKEIMTI
ncbi:MAG: ribosome recycling factor [Bacteroidetes bacterium]|nr:ribosome recycling factor [Bacteroidota bacterium]